MAPSEVVDEQELPQWGAGPPDDNFRSVLFFGLMNPPNEGGNNVGVFRVKVVARAVDIGRHGGDPVATILNAVGLRLLDASNFRHGVGRIGRLELPSQQRVFGDWLWCKLRINTGGAEEDKPVDSRFRCSVHQVDLDLNVLGEKFGWVGVVGVDAADSGGRINNQIRGVVRQVLEYSVSVEQVELAGRWCVDGGNPAALEFPNNRSSDEPTSARDKDFRLRRQSEGQVSHGGAPRESRRWATPSLEWRGIWG